MAGSKLQWGPTVDFTSIFSAAGIVRAALFLHLKGPLAFIAFAGNGYSVLFTMVFELGEMLMHKFKYKSFENT